MVTKNLENIYRQREQSVLNEIRTIAISATEYSIFGSYARGNYTSRSDIDFIVLYTDDPPRHEVVQLNALIDKYQKVDVVIRKMSILRDATPFAKALQRDYIRRSV